MLIEVVLLVCGICVVIALVCYLAWRFVVKSILGCIPKIVNLATSPDPGRYREAIQTYVWALAVPVISIGSATMIGDDYGWLRFLLALNGVVVGSYIADSAADDEEMATTLPYTYHVYAEYKVSTPYGTELTSGAICTLVEIPFPLTVKTTKKCFPIMEARVASRIRKSEDFIGFAPEECDVEVGITSWTLIPTS